jgi:hypothetical protein
VGGSETLAAIRDSVLSKPEIHAPPPPPGSMPVPGMPMVQPNFNGNFLPGFNGNLAKLRVIIRR